jgi:hypothetical protein
LNQICKRFEINQKSEKEKGKEIKKRKRAEGKRIGPVPNQAHGQAGQNPESVFPLSLPKLTPGPHPSEPFSSTDRPGPHVIAFL